MSENHFEVYSRGMCCMSICTNIEDRDEIRRWANRENPTGIDSQWDFSEDKTFAQGGPQPGTCELGKGTHYLMIC